MLTSYPDEEAVLSAIVAGASGYLLKQIRARDLVAALEAVGRGESLLDPAVTEKVLERVRRIATGDVHRRAGPADRAGAEDPAARRRGQDEQGDRERGLPVGQDGEELRQLDPLEAQPRAARPGRRVRRQAPHSVRASAGLRPAARGPVASAGPATGGPAPARRVRADAVRRRRSGRPLGRAARPRLRRMRIVTAEEAVAGIRSGDQIYVQCAPPRRRSCSTRSSRGRPELHDVEVVHLHTRGPGPPPRARDGRPLPPPGAVHRPERPGGRQRGPGRLRAGVPVGRARTCSAAGCCPLDAVLINVTPPDAHGFCSLGTSVEAMHAAIRGREDRHRPAQPVDAADARREVHPRRRDRPRRRGGRPALRATPTREIGDVERRIGEFVADLVPDGATLQMGIGAIPSAVAQFLRDKRDLGIHTEMFTDVVVDLVEAGVVTGLAKERNRGKIVAAFMMGTQQAVPVRPRQPDGRDARRATSRTTPTSSAAFRRMTAINSAIEVDLTGQVVRRLDRLAGCTAASAARWTSSAAPRWRPRAGRSSRCRRRRPAATHVADRAVPRGGRRRRHDPGPRPDGRHRVGRRRAATGKSLRERAKALIAIAHPDFRDELTAQARRPTTCRAAVRRGVAARAPASAAPRRPYRTKT